MSISVSYAHHTEYYYNIITILGVCHVWLRGCIYHFFIRPLPPYDMYILNGLTTVSGKFDNAISFYGFIYFYSAVVVVLIQSQNNNDNTQLFSCIDRFCFRIINKFFPLSLYSLLSLSFLCVQLAIYCSSAVSYAYV